MGVKHHEVATRDDGPDDGRVQPSWWNDDHDIGAFLTAIFGLAVAPNTIPYVKTDGSASITALSEFARGLLAKVDAGSLLVALAGAPLLSPNLIGVPTAPTALLNTNTTQIATMQALQQLRADMINSAPATLDTFNEIASAIGNDPNFATTILTALGNRLRFDTTQTLSAPQKAQALANLGIVLGSAAGLNVGTAAGQVVQLDGSARLPAVDGSNLTNLVATNVGYVAAGTGAVSRSVAQIINDYSNSVANYGAVGDGVTPADAAINRALAANNAIFVPPGTYRLNAGLKARTGAIIAGIGFEKTRLSRNGVWAGNTLDIGDINSASSGQFSVSGLLFEQFHPGFVAGTSTTLTDRLTNDQSHIGVYGGSLGRIKECWFQYGCHAIDVYGATSLDIDGCLFIGSWCDDYTGLKETSSYIRIQNHGTWGIATMHKVLDCYVAGIPSPSKTYTFGTASFTSQGNGGAAYGIELLGCEGFEQRGGYIGGQNRFGARLAPKASIGGSTAMLTSAVFSDTFHDGNEIGNIQIDQTTAGLMSTMIAIQNNKCFNGQLISPSAIRVENPNGQPVVAALTISGNPFQAHNGCPLIILGARAAMISNNIIGSYNARNGYDYAADGSSGAYIAGASTDVHLAGNLWGGGINDWSATNNCQFGPYFAVTTGCSASNERGILGKAGGALIGGLTQTYPT